MADPFRLKVLKKLTEVLRSVRPSNTDFAPMTYQFDLSGAVFRGRMRYGETDPLPMVSILEPPIPLDVIRSSGANTKSSGDWELLIQGFVKDDKENPTDPAHRLMAEVKHRLVMEKRVASREGILGSHRIMEMHIGQGVVRPPDEVSGRAFFWLMLTLKLSEALDDPYAPL